MLCSVFQKTVHPSDMRPCHSISLLHPCLDLGGVYRSLCAELWSVWVNDFSLCLSQHKISTQLKILKVRFLLCLCLGGIGQNSFQIDVNLSLKVNYYFLGLNMAVLFHRLTDT